MTEDGDRIDPARTEATIKRSLEKANQRRVKMTGMVERIEAHLQNDDAATRHYECDNLLEEAQAEIEKLRSYLDGTSKAYERVLSERNDFWKSRDKAWDENQKLQERIAELDGFIVTINEQTTALEAENERLNKALKWEQHRAGRVGTHSPGCWQWGSQHYECAMRHITSQEKDLESAALIVGEIRKDMIEARTEIREMNRRIDLLRSRS